MKREELKCPVVDEYYGECEWESHPNKYYDKSEADAVMDGYEAKIKELEAENARLKAANFDLQSHFDVLKEDYEELKKKVPVWISVKDRLPNEKEQNELLWVAYVRTDNTIKYIYEASFDYETKQFYTENDWGDRTFISPSIWIVVPPPPTTEESSATEKENG